MYRIVILLSVLFFFIDFGFAQNPMHPEDKKEISQFHKEIKKLDEAIEEDCERMSYWYFKIAKKYQTYKHKTAAIKYFKEASKLTKDYTKKYNAYKGISDLIPSVENLQKTIVYADSAGIYTRDKLLPRIDLSKKYLRSRKSKKGRREDYKKALELSKEALELSFDIGGGDAQESISLIEQAYKKLNNTPKLREYSKIYNLKEIREKEIKYLQVEEDDEYLDKLYYAFVSLKNSLAEPKLTKQTVLLDSSLVDIILNISRAKRNVTFEVDSINKVLNKTTVDLREKKAEIAYLDSINTIFIAFAVIVFILLSIAVWGYIVKRKQHRLLNQQKYKIELQANELNNKNNDLLKAFEHLKTTQNQLVQTEKMASLGQLIAGIAHELNTPLGAIKSSIGTIIDSSSNSVTLILKLVKILDDNELRLFTEMVETGLLNTELYTSREERAIKKRLKQELEDNNIENSRKIAGNLIDIGIHKIENKTLSLLAGNNVDLIMETAYNLVVQNKNGNNIKIAVDRASKIIFALKNYSHTSQDDKMVEVNIADNIDTVLTIYHNQLKQGIIVERKFDNLPQINCFPDELSQVWTNILHNSIQAMDSKGKLFIKGKFKNNLITISFKDNGKGIPKDIQDKIFEPFFTTKASGEGTGLGLDIIKKIIEKHNGTISFESKEGAGTTFFVNLPLNKK